MRPLSAEEVMSVWEWGQDRPADEWALRVLAVVRPEASRDDIAYLTIGRRNAWLLTLREWTLGSRLRSFTECPQCAERLEFTLETRDLYVDDTHPEGEHEIAHMEYRVRFRTPNSLDLWQPRGPPARPERSRNYFAGACSGLAAKASASDGPIFPTP